VRRRTDLAHCCCKGLVDSHYACEYQVRVYHCTAVYIEIYTHYNIMCGACHSTTALAPVTADFFFFLRDMCDGCIGGRERGSEGHTYMYDNTLVNDARDPAGLSFDCILFCRFFLFTTPPRLYTHTHTHTHIIVLMRVHHDDRRT